MPAQSVLGGRLRKGGEAPLRGDSAGAREPAERRAGEAGEDALAPELRAELPVEADRGRVPVDPRTRRHAATLGANLRIKRHLKLVETFLHLAEAGGERPAKFLVAKGRPFEPHCQGGPDER